MGGKDPLLVPLLQNVDQPALKVWMQEDIRFVEDEGFCAPMAIQVKEELEPNLQSIASPEEFLD